jgi:hypothetical protein
VSHSSLSLLIATHACVNADANANDDANDDGTVLVGVAAESEGGMHPIDIITEAWHATTAQKVLGSSTICIATIDTAHNQLLYSNIGDCGLMVLRHIDSEVAGYMR